MSTAHIFYLPIIFVVGLFAGYFIGRVQAEKDLEERRKKARRRAAAKQLAAGGAGDSTESDDSDETA